MREQVKLAVRRELQDWFVAIRMASRTIGTQAMEHFQKAQAQAAEARSLEVGHPVDPISIPPEDVEFNAEDERTCCRRHVNARSRSCAQAAARHIRTV